MIVAADISIPSGTCSLEGTLTTPGDSTGPAALLVSGSGPIDRDSNTRRMRIDVMGQIASQLADHGIASLRYDKRGVGASDGEYLTAGFHDNVADARAALEVLRARHEVDPNQVVVIGHSEGALIAAELATDSRLAGVALLAGTARNGRDVLTWQARQVASTLPRPVRWLMKLLRQDLVRTQQKRLDRIAASTDDVIRIQLVKLNAKWFREFMAFDPTPALREAAVPVLAITGSKDIQVDPTDVGLIGQIVPTSFTGHVVDDVSHLLRLEPGPASVKTYKKQSRQPLDPRVIDRLTDWVGARTHTPETQPTMTYDDGTITLDDEGITIHNYVLPGRPKHIPYAEIVHAEWIPLGFWTGRHQLMGIGPFRPTHFFHWDRKRAGRSRGVSLDRGTRIRVAITPDDPDRVLGIIRKKISEHAA